MKEASSAMQELLGVRGCVGVLDFLDGFFSSVFWSCKRRLRID